MSEKTTFWNSPVPYFESRRETGIAIVGFCIFLLGFLLFFQPFGVNNYDPRETISSELVLALLCTTTVLGIFLAVNEMLVRPRLFDELTGTSAFLWLLWNLILLSTVIYLVYNILGGWHDWHLKSYLEFIINVGAMSIIPVSAIIFYLYQKGLHRKLMSLTMEKDDVTDPAGHIVLAEDNGEKISLPVDQILYLESQDNYVAIYYNNGQGIQRHLLRGTMKRLAAEVEGSTLMQCHRAYVVNISRVKRYAGNMHKMALNIEDSERVIPVSRNYTGKIRQRLAG